MAFLYTHSCECVKSELHIFTLPPTQTTIEHSQWIHYKPISSITGNSPIEFAVANLGLKKRREMLKAKTIDLIGHLHADIFNQEKLLINGVEIRVRLVRSKEGFAIMDPTGLFDTDIQEATLLIRRVKISPSVLIAHASTLAKTTAKYNITRVEVKTVALHQGIQGDTLDNIILGQLPKRIILGFVSHNAFNGQKNLNPYNFHHFDLNYLSLYIDGVQIPSKPLQPDYVNSSLYVESYHTLFSGTGIHFLNQGNSIARDDYPEGYCLYAFDLTPDLSANDDTHFNLVRHGSVRIEVRFGSILTETVNCVIYTEYNTVLEIDQAR